ncbi:MAG: hypothetical protein OEL81_04710, partial [Nitrosopumilus sp.]|nr:hypothetical protein [Nitrosopumilus sp.]
MTEINKEKSVYLFVHGRKDLYDTARNLLVENEFHVLKNALLEKYGIVLPEGLKTAAIEKFGDIASAPILYENVTNSIIRKKIEEGENNITIKNPKALYRIGVLGFLELVNLNLTIEG